jgi:hypothetical protein
MTNDIGGAGVHKRVLIVCQLDKFANGVKPIEVERFLRNRGHDVRVVNTYSLSKASAGSKLPHLSPRRSLLFAVQVAGRLFTQWTFGRRRLSYYVLLSDYRLRRSILRRLLSLDDYDLVICEIPHDAGILTAPTSARTLYDCPTPWADELYFEGRLTGRQDRKLRHLETELFESVTPLAFWWNPTRAMPFANTASAVAIS